ncbi:MAG TPA: Uma2 family endonuclease [Bacteroidota bacterium]|nr:Uma2 family endonuclease [Bacteroidota bacterium]
MSTAPQRYITPDEYLEIERKAPFIPTNPLYASPDIVVVCGRQEFLDAQRDTLTNPTVIMEVLSESPEHCDRGLKFESYRGLPLQSVCCSVALQRFASWLSFHSSRVV